MSTDGSSRAAPRARLARALVVLLALVAFAGIALAFATRTVSVAFVSGNSMVPTARPGALVVFRDRSQYAPGDVVAYHNPELGLVMHRIVAVAVGGAASVRLAGSGPIVVNDNATKLVLRGDNKNTVDSYNPTLSDVQGQLVFMVPGVAQYADHVRDPRALGLLATFVAVLVFLRFVGKNEHGRRARRALAASARTPVGTALAIAFAVVGLAAAGAFLALRAAGPQHKILVGHDFDHTGTFSYRAAGGDGIYDTAVAQTGDPIFRRLASRADVTFAYDFKPSDPAHQTGTVALSARITQSNSWKRSIVLLAPMPFNGSRISTTAALDLDAVQRLVDSVAEQTGIDPRAYQLTVVADVQTDVTVAGRRLTEAFAAELPFSVNEKQLQPLPSATGVITWSHSRHGSISTAAYEVRRISALGVSVRGTTAQRASALALAASLAGLVCVGGLALGARHPDSASAIIRRQYRHLLVKATARREDRTGRLIAVHSFEDLARLAEMAGSLIVDEDIDVGARFTMVQPGVTYYFDITPVSERHLGLVEAAA